MATFTCKRCGFVGEATIWHSNVYCIVRKQQLHKERENIRRSNEPGYREKLNVRQYKWLEVNPQKLANHAAHSIAKKHNRPVVMVPGEEEAIGRMYLRAQELTNKTGEQHDVEHMTPLDHELVCGLHVLSNLWVLRHKDNVNRAKMYHPDWPL